MIELSDEARSWLAEKGYDRLNGARPMARLIQNELKRPLADSILFGELQNGGVVRVSVSDGKLVLQIEPRDGGSKDSSSKEPASKSSASAK